MSEVTSSRHVYLLSLSSCLVDSTQLVESLDLNINQMRRYVNAECLRQTRFVEHERLG